MLFVSVADGGGHVRADCRLDTAKYLELAGNGTRWDQLPDNTAFPARRNVLISATDPRCRG